MAVITREQLENASRDANDFATVVNGSETVNGDGRVPTRLGGRVRTVRRTVADMGAFNPRGAWATATAYAFKDLFTSSGVAYIVLVPHTSTSVAADLASGYIAIYQGTPAGSIVAASLSNDSGDLTAIAAKLNAVRYAGNGAVVVNGGTTSGLGLARDDAGMAIIAPVAGTPTQRHALFLFEAHADDEWGIVGFHPIDGVKTQTGTYFNALQDHDDDPLSFRPYQAMHGVSWRGDFTPFVAYHDNAVEVCGGFTGAQVFDQGYTKPDWFHAFFNSHLQGPTVMGDHDESVQSGNMLEVAGPGFFGAVDPTTKQSTLGLMNAWHTPSGQALVQSISYIPLTSQFQPLGINASEIRLGQGHTVPDADNTRDLGKTGGAFRNLFVVNAPTVTSDARLKRVRGDGQLTPEEIAWAADIAKLFKIYQRLDSIEEKGDEARLHIGVLAQEIVAAGKARGLDPFRYGFITLDPMFEEESYFEDVAEQDVEMELIPYRRVEIRDGEPVWVTGTEERPKPKVEMRPVRDAITGKVKTRLEPHPDGPYAIIDPNTQRPKERPPVEVPVMAPVPVMISKSVKHTRQVPVILPEAQKDQPHVELEDGRLQDMRLGIRYEGLFGLLIAAGVSQPAGE